jgi:2-hydroxychromene-2-carboxylate isomerase
VYRDGFRYAALHGIPLRCPKFHPYNPLSSLRMSLAEVAGDDQPRVVEALFRAGWTDGIDLGSTDELVAALGEAGLDGRGILARSEAPSAKDALKRETTEAIGRGVFGVPTMLCGEELFWGNDRIDHLELHLDGKDPLDPHRGQVQEILARPRMADRPGKGGRA